MIELIPGERGLPTLARDGRLLASRFDPFGEARAWLARHTAFLNKVKTVFVLGLGAGYHIPALLETSPARVIVIEPDPEVIAACMRIHSFPAERVRIEACTSVRALRASQPVREGVRQSFTVLVHPASRLSDPEFYKECAAQLTGRDWGTLTWQWQLKESPALDSTPRAGSGPQPLSIYDLEQTELVQNSEERERLLIKALRELVK